jgi:hypothetical protein
MEYALRERRIARGPLQHVRIIEHVRGNKWKAKDRTKSGTERLRGVWLPRERVVFVRNEAHSSRDREKGKILFNRR